MDHLMYKFQLEFNVLKDFIKIYHQKTKINGKIFNLLVNPNENQDKLTEM